MLSYSTVFVFVVYFSKLLLLSALYIVVAQLLMQSIT